MPGMLPSFYEKLTSAVRVRKSFSCYGISRKAGPPERNRMEQEKRTYDFDRFTEEDALLYREILNSLPFDPELNRFFLEQRHSENRSRYLRKRYHADCRPGALDYAPRMPSAEQEFFREEMGRELDAAMLRLPLPVRKRIEMRCVCGLTYTAIAAIEHVSESAVEQSVKSGLRRLRTAVRAGKIPLLRPEP